MPQRLSILSLVQRRVYIGAVVLAYRIERDGRHLVLNEDRIYIRERRLLGMLAAGFLLGRVWLFQIGRAHV